MDIPFIYEIIDLIGSNFKGYYVASTFVIIYDLKYNLQFNRKTSADTRLMSNFNATCRNSTTFSTDRSDVAFISIL